MGSYLNDLLHARRSPLPLTTRRSSTRTAKGKLVFQPHFVQRGAGPHLLDWAYASDEKWDAFRSDISASREGVAITDSGDIERFEALYTLAYSRPSIEACNWFDFVDPHSYIDNGGLIKSPRGEPKEAFDRLLSLRKEWDSLPDVKS